MDFVLAFLGKYRIKSIIPYYTAKAVKMQEGEQDSALPFCDQ
jgi:hypothetical protein